MAEGSIFDKIKAAFGVATDDFSDKARELAESAAEKIDEATEANGGVAKKVGDVIGSGKEEIGDAAATLVDKYSGGGGGGAA